MAGPAPGGLMRDGQVGPGPADLARIGQFRVVAVHPHRQVRLSQRPVVSGGAYPYIATRVGCLVAAGGTRCFS